MKEKNEGVSLGAVNKREDDLRRASRFSLRFSSQFKGNVLNNVKRCEGKSKKLPPTVQLLDIQHGVLAIEKERGYGAANCVLCTWLPAGAQVATHPLLAYG
jgi:hypothetical protein